MKLKDLNTRVGWEDEWYYLGIQVPIRLVGRIELDGNIDRESDRRLVTVMTPSGKRAVIYHDVDGFKEIKIKVEPITVG